MFNLFTVFYLTLLTFIFNISIPPPKANRSIRNLPYLYYPCLCAIQTLTLYILTCKLLIISAWCCLLNSSLSFPTHFLHEVVLITKIYSLGCYPYVYIYFTDYTCPLQAKRQVQTNRRISRSSVQHVHPAMSWSAAHCTRHESHWWHL